MKKKDIKEWCEKNIEELKVLLNEAKTELSHLRLELSTQKVKNVRQIMTKRKKIAALLTIIREKEIKNG